MPKKVYRMENLECANCAAKMERKFQTVTGVEAATITFATKQLHLTAQDPDALIPQLESLARTVESQVTILVQEEHSGCHCGHHHEEHHSCGCGHHHEEHSGCSCGHHHEEHSGCSCGHHHEEHSSCGCGHHHEEHSGCSCGHHHAEHSGCTCGHHHDHHRHGNQDLRDILIGAGCFAAGLATSALGWKIPALVIFALGYLVLGREILVKAFRNLTRGHFLDENFLMSSASLGAFCIGEAAEGVGVMLFYRVGEYFEERAMERSRKQIMDAVDLRPETVNLLEGEDIRVIPAGEAKLGDLLLVRPGDRIPLDGKVIRGESRLDTAPITGEPVPVSVFPGSEVTSGCVNGQGQLVIRAEKPLSDSMVTRILNSVESAAASKPRIDRFITRFARIYTPIVVAAALLVAIVPSLITGQWSYWVYTALSFLVMSCPCALVLSVPLAYFSGIGAGSRKGILFKGGLSMEAMHGVKAVVMDKTGTLTQGDFRVRQIGGGLDVLALCASCEQQSSHPIAQSITAAAKERNMPLFQPDQVEELAGQGIRAQVENRTILCGNLEFLRSQGVTAEPVEFAGTVVYIAENGQYLGFITIADTIKENAQAAVAGLHNQKLHTVMLTGDNQATARAVAQELNIREVHGKLLPHQKLEQLQKIRSQRGAVMFVGDGINDAPVLAGADVGCAMGSGADAAIEAADVVFMTPDPQAIPQAISIAKKTNAIARQNVIFALAVKALVMVLGLCGYASMWLAVFADSGVAMLCVLNSIRSLYSKK